MPPVTVDMPWWAHVEPVVAAVRARDSIDVTILRLLESELPQQPGGLVTYLAEVAAPVAGLAPWHGRLDDHPLRQTYARPGRPAADLDWATAVMRDRGIVAAGPPVQVKTWNLSSLWRLPAESGDVWLKSVPPFFAHEASIIDALAGERVPTLFGHDRGRLLIAAIPGDDLFEASDAQRRAMVPLLVDLQRKWIGRSDELFALGLPDWRAHALTAKIADVVARTPVAPQTRATLDAFVAHLPQRFAAIAACGIPDTLVHGDFHPGNLRGQGEDLTLLDWGDSGVGHPLLDQAAFLDRVPDTLVALLAADWTAAWQAAIPGSDPVRAAELLAPIGAARQAVIYRMFLDNIEPSERAYHADDPAEWLERTAELARKG